MMVIAEGERGLHRRAGPLQIISRHGDTRGKGCVLGSDRTETDSPLDPALEDSAQLYPALTAAIIMILIDRVSLASWNWTNLDF